MMFAELLAARGGRGIGRFIRLAIDGDPIALTILGVIVVIILVIAGIAIYNAAITPESDISDEDLTPEERALMNRFDD